MKKLFSSLILLLTLAVATPCSGQLNKNYFYFIGRDFFLENKYKEAIETLNILLRVDKNAHEGYFLRGIAKYQLDDLLGAEADFTTAIEKNPVFTTAYLDRAITRSRMGNYDDALRDFQEAINLRPDRPDAYYSRGVTFLLTQQFERAISDFDEFILREGRVADAYINRGTAYLYQRDTTAAFNNFNQAIRTNRENPDGYARRGSLFMAQKRYGDALTDFNKSIDCDSTHLPALFNRAMVYNQINRPMLALQDFDRVLKIDSTNSQTYFNEAIIKTSIGDYNGALADYDKVALYSPNNVLVYFNRAILYGSLGDLDNAMQDYNRAIELYPDFANAYLNRANIKYMLQDTRGAQRDRSIAERKISEYRSKLNDSTFSIYADTSRKFNQLLAFDSKPSRGALDRTGAEREENVSLRPLYKFTFVKPVDLTEQSVKSPHRYYLDRVEGLLLELRNPYMSLTNRDCDLTTEELIEMDRTLAAKIDGSGSDWATLFTRAVTQVLIRQYTDAVNTLTRAIELDPTNPFLYLNRSTVRAEMIDFISSIDNNYHRISIESDPMSRMRNSARNYNYDECIADLNKAIKLYPQFAHLYYNRANLRAISGQLPEAFDDYSQSIELNPDFGDAYFNRGLVQIYMKDTRKGCLDLSKAGELGVEQAYAVLKRYAPQTDNE